MSVWGHTLVAQYWGLKAIGKAVGLKSISSVLDWYWERGLPMMLRRNGYNSRRVWWTTDGILNPWLMQMVQQQRKERKGLLVARESRARVRSGNGKAPQQPSQPTLDVVTQPPPPDPSEHK